MTQFRFGRLAAALAIPLLSQTLCAQDLAHVIFLEPLSKVDTTGAEISVKMPLYRKSADQDKYAPWLRNESAERALRLYRAAYELAHPGGDTPDYYVALVPDGNHADVGFRLQNGDKIDEFPRQAYILLDASPDRFEGTLLHETGHVAMCMLAGGRRLDGNSTSSIPHTTAALIDRSTAFSEGYAIHLETLAAHLNRDARTRQRFHREAVVFGDASEYVWAAEAVYPKSGGSGPLRSRGRSAATACGRSGCHPEGHSRSSWKLVAGKPVSAPRG